LAFLFTLLFALLCFSHCDVVVGVLWFLYYPLVFFLAGIGNGQESIKNLYFFNKYFSLCLFSFFNLFISCLLFLCFFLVLIFLAFGLWCRACYNLFWRQT
jgi:hypothetical protein